MTSLQRVETLVERGGIVKIDGLRAPDQAVAAVEAGADLLGFVFADARRRVTPSIAEASLERARRVALGRTVFAVGVFVDQLADEIDAIVRTVGLDVVQLHGAEDPSVLDRLSVAVIKALRPAPGTEIDEVERTIGAFLDRPRPAIAVVLDGYSPGAAGGTGVRADWGMAAELASRWPIILAGGLRPDNVAAAIAKVRPVGVDVSSGVETAGVKDADKMAAFAAAARVGFEQVAGEGMPAPSPRRRH